MVSERKNYQFCNVLEKCIVLAVNKWSSYFRCKILSREFTHFFRRFFWTEKQNPQKFLLLGCMEKYKSFLLKIETLVNDCTALGHQVTESSAYLRMPLQYWFQNVTFTDATDQGSNSWKMIFLQSALLLFFFFFSSSSAASAPFALHNDSDGWLYNNSYDNW